MERIGTMNIAVLVSLIYETFPKLSSMSKKFKLPAVISSVAVAVVLDASIVKTEVKLLFSQTTLLVQRRVVESLTQTMLGTVSSVLQPGPVHSMVTE